MPRQARILYRQGSGPATEEEYRIAATEQKLDPHHFVISRKTNVRLRGAG